MPFVLIASVGDNGVIGKNGALAWHDSDDAKRFKRLTSGKTVLMGRKTWESLPPKFRPLPDRENAVVTRDPSYALPPGVLRFASLQAARGTLEGREVFVIGGATVYDQTLSWANRLEITHVHQALDGDVTFPSIDKAAWKEVARDSRAGFSFVTYERRPRA